jgi:3-oxoacyl-[acyl-carrier protein] reductase
VASVKFDATGEVLIVTGGARGIGAGLARAYAAAGGHVVVFDVAPAAEGELYTSGPGTIEQQQVDVSDRDAVLAATAAVAEKYGRVDALLAGAAIQPRVDVLDTTPDVWHETLAVNLDGVVWAVQGAVPHMVKAQRGSVVVFASGLANFGRAQAGAYAATKGALIPFAKSLAAELADDGVKVNVVFPGVIDTEQFRAANPGSEREYWQETTGIGTPDDVAGPLMFLLSDAATMTGSTLSRDRAYTRPAGDRA